VKVLVELQNQIRDAATDAERKEYESLKEQLGLTGTASTGTKMERPIPPAAYDRPVQMWLYVIGCGVLGVPWFLWQWLAAARLRFRMEDDGTLDAGTIRVAADHIADIDMSKWMSKSIATVVTTDGKRIVLDDYKYRGMDKIVGAIATRFYPDDWTPDARDLKRIREQEAADAASAAGDSKSNAGA
jgi:hypothetical protein